MSTAPSARRQLPELVELDAAFTVLHADTPNIPPLGIDTAFRARYDAWTARRDALVIQRDIVLVRLSRYLCARCAGTGLTVHGHRHGGMCYQCGGDGWTAAGRRFARSNLTTNGREQP